MGSAAKALGTAAKNMLRGCIRISLNLIVPKPQHHPTLLFKKLGSSAVVAHRRFGVLAPVQLDHEPRCAACKINDVRSDRQLACEPGPKMAQAQPKPPLRFS